MMAHRQEVLNCLDTFLSAKCRAPRIDTDGPVLLRDIVLKFEERANKEVKRQLQSVPAHRRRSVNIFFNEDESYGAFAVHDRYDYIVLHIGVLRILDFFDRMMENPALWTNVAKSEPNDRIRLAFAVVFMNECFDIIVRHEFAHLIFGHCKFRARGIDGLAAQALEVAADGYAVNWGVQRLGQFPKILGLRTNAVAQAYRAFHRTSDEAMRNYLLAIYFVFRLMDETTWINGTLASRAHPPAPIRFQVACLYAHEYLEQIGDADGQARLTRAMQEIWELGEFIFAATLDKTPDFKAKQQVMEIESERHFELVRERAKDLPPSLFGLS